VFTEASSAFVTLPSTSTEPPPLIKELLDRREQALKPDLNLHSCSLGTLMKNMRLQYQSPKFDEFTKRVERLRRIGPDAQLMGVVTYFDLRKYDVNDVKNTLPDHVPGGVLLLYMYVF